eukprot:CAMPEP_0197028854 /NCGR_PEP_ID=MMETSP1384-20130603/8445_1 /TAXON_ID=29189 /ORGANISM="Ammonia sp." /LENGTH=824 /DNA_ID=CAMNT_0042457919 /DNA_START=11 /DNA_END=2485 /DNA_ORIENTATION=+
MKLSLHEPREKHHEGMVYNVCWNPVNNELVSIADDKQLLSWRMNREAALDDGIHQNVYTPKKVLSLSHHCLATSWCPDQSFLAAAFTDGSLRIISFEKSSSMLKIDKVIENAHHGAVICLAWSLDGTALVTGGEDGVIKQWSRSGNLRSKLFQSSNAIHSVSWSPNNQCIVYASDKFVGIQSVQGKLKKSKKWKAHSGIVLCLDWNPINNVLITGGEDCHYRIWDEFGRLIYCSKVFNYPITALSWSSNGKYFAVGSYNLALLCDAQGWIHHEMNLKHGSVLSVNWTPDSTHLSMGCANGHVLFGQITNRSILYQHYNVTLNEQNQITIQDILSADFHSVYETLEFNESVITFSIQYDYLIVITSKQCYIYQLQSVTTPQIIPLKQGTVVYVILQTPSFFILVNNLNGIHVIGYEGRSICQLKAPSLKPKLLNTHNICATNDTLAVVDVLDQKCVHFFDPFTCRTLADSVKHSTNVTEIALNVSITSSLRQLAFIDNNKDLFITKVHYQSPFKLKTIVDSIAWHPECDILLALSDKQLVIWYYPSMVWCDADLLAYSVAKIDTQNIGSNGKIISVEGTLVTVRKNNGDEEIINFSPLPLAMYDAIRDGKWSKALRLCNLCKDETLWASLTGLAIDNGQIEVALQGLTALEEPDKILFLRSIQSLPLQAQRDAELALYRKNSKGAENILIQNDLTYRAIELNMRLFKWKRALELALDCKTHVDTVIAMRHRYLQKLKKEESIELFLKHSNHEEINWSEIEAKCAQEIDREYQMAGVHRTFNAENDDNYNRLPFMSQKTRKSGRKELEALLGIQSNTDATDDSNDF